MSAMHGLWLLQAFKSSARLKHTKGNPFCTFFAFKKSVLVIVQFQTDSKDATKDSQGNKKNCFIDHPFERHLHCSLCDAKVTNLLSDLLFVSSGNYVN